jgi:hypothetical protein
VFPVAHANHGAIDGRQADAEMVRICLRQFRDISCDIPFVKLLILLMDVFNNAFYLRYGGHILPHRIRFEAQIRFICVSPNYEVWEQP